MPQRTVIITAASNFGVQYNYGCITEALVWLRALYFVAESDPASTAITTAVFYGTLIGMLSFGVIGDILGRNEGMVLTLSIQAIERALAPYFAPPTSVAVDASGAAMPPPKLSLGVLRRHERAVAALGVETAHSGAPVEAADDARLLFDRRPA